MNNAITGTTATPLRTVVETDCTDNTVSGGDGVIDSVKRDDGNTTSGDGCSAQCQLTPGKIPPGQPCCVAQV